MRPRLTLEVRWAVRFGTVVGFSALSIMEVGKGSSGGRPRRGGCSVGHTAALFVHLLGRLEGALSCQAVGSREPLGNSKKYVGLAMHSNTCLGHSKSLNVARFT